MKSFQIATDVNTQPTACIHFSDYVNVQQLRSGIPESIILPTDARFVLFSSTGDFFSRIDADASISSSDVTDGSGSELNPTIRSLVGITSLSLVAPKNCTVTMAFYA